MNLPLFYRDAPHNGTETSRSAAQEIRRALPALESRVLAHLAGMVQGATNEELENALGMGGSTLRPRVVELRNRGLVRDSGKRRNTRSGRAAVVWEFVR